MTLKSIHYRPEFEIEFTREEVKTMNSCSNSHYDAACRASSQVGGLTYGFRMRFLNPKQSSITVLLSFRDVDRLCKLLEISPYASNPKVGSKLFVELQQLLKDENKRQENKTC